MSDLDANLKRIMRRAKLKPSQLARLAGVQKSSLSQLASGLQCTTDELLGVENVEVSRPVLAFEITQMVHEMGHEGVAKAHDAVSAIYSKEQRAKSNDQRPRITNNRKKQVIWTYRN